MARPVVAEWDERVRRQVAQWREDLLDLGRRQRLIHFRHLPVGSLELRAPSVSTVLAELAADRGSFHLPDSGDHVASGLVVVGKNARELEASLQRIVTKSQEDFVERGISTLHLALGMLSWQDGSDVVESPIVLQPVSLHRPPKGTAHRLRRGDEPAVNPALALKLLRDHGLRLPALAEHEDIDHYLDAVDHAVAGRPGWLVQRRFVLANFASSKEAIHQDLVANEEAIVRHPVLRVLAGATDELPGLVFAPRTPEQDLDAAVAPEHLHTVLDADASQTAAILAARDGRSFVLEGPPGTGKSQTITNVVAELIAAGRSVLFVSEKAAALDVVHARLKARGLDRFVLPLHSSSTGRKVVAAELAHELDSPQRRRPGAADHAVTELRRRREDLSGYAAAVSERRRDLGSSVHDVVGRLAHLGDPHGRVDAQGRWRLDSDRLLRIQDAATALSYHWRPVEEGERFRWRDLAPLEAGAATVDRVVDAARAAHTATTDLQSVVQRMDTAVPLGFATDADGRDRRSALLHALTDDPGCPAAWLTVPDLSAVHDRVTALRRSTEEFAGAAATATRLVGPRWRDLDPDGVGAADVAALPLVGAVVELPASTTFGRLRRLLEVVQDVPRMVEETLGDVRWLGAIFGVPVQNPTLQRAVDLARLGSLAGRAARPEGAWFNPTVHRELDASRAALAPLVDLVRRHRNELSATFRPDVLALDLADLRARSGAGGLSARRARKEIAAVSVAARWSPSLADVLPDLAAWQQAENHLRSTAERHASVLGLQWREVDTDFVRIAEARDTAHEAVALVGVDLDVERVSEQLANGTVGHARLLPVATVLTARLAGWSRDLTEVLGPVVTEELERAPWDVLVQAAVEFAEALRPVVDVVDRVSEVAGRSLTLGQCRTALRAATDASTRLTHVFEAYEDDHRILGGGYDGVDTDWESVGHDLEWAAWVRELLPGPVDARTVDRLRSLPLSVEEFDTAVSSHAAAVEALTGLFVQARAAEISACLTGGLAGAREFLEALLVDADRHVRDWIDHAVRWTALEDLGFRNLLTVLRTHQAPAEEVVRAVEVAALTAWVDQTVADDPRLGSHRAAERDGVVAAFRRLDTEFVASTAAVVAAACLARRAEPGVGYDLIRKEGAKKIGHRPVRELLSAAGEAAQVLKPCFMMSPLSVSQYLPAGLTFDAVVFDEASQVTPEDAVNCVYRGRQVIIAGDPKQLPPTSYFATQRDEDEEFDAERPETYESVLTAARAAGLVVSTLDLHYRSRHQDLIEFSRAHFYSPPRHPRAMQAFPGATFDAADLGIGHHLVEGVYGRGTTRTNPQEATKVVDLVLHHRRRHPDLTLGVVAFSAAQAEAVEAELQRRAATEPLLLPLLERSDRLNGFFVKNLENVQGDERDVILMTTAYGPDLHGKLTQQYGPLGQKQWDVGWRRLNVAITRARRRLEVVTSLSHRDVLPAVDNTSVQYLREFLRFAESGRAASGPVGEDDGGLFERRLLELVRAWGHQADAGVGSGAYRVPVAVRHPQRAGEYVLAVECDGSAYTSTPVARERDRIRPAVLDGLGWRVHHVWEVAWHRDPQGEQERLRRAIEDAIAGTPVAPVREPRWASPPAANVERLTPVDGAAVVPAEAAAPSPPALEDRRTRGYLGEFVVRVVTAEAPLHEQLLGERVAGHWEVARLSQRQRTLLDLTLDELVRDGGLRRDRRGFYRAGGVTGVQVRFPATAAAARRLRHVSRDEIRAAVLLLVPTGEVTEERLSRELKRRYLWAEPVPAVRSEVDVAVSLLLDRGQLRRGPGGDLIVC